MSGSDAPSFLQGQFTNELRGLAPGGAVYGLWLTVKGKVLADSFVVRGVDDCAGAVDGTSGASGAGGADVYWVGSYHSPATVIRERLEAFVIADDVVIEDATAEWEGITIFGGDAEKSVGVGFVFPSRRGGGREWVFPTAQHAEAWNHLAAQPVLDAAEVERRRIAAGAPAVPADIGPADLPNEAGLEATAISFTKGCYLGQEVMARLKSMGQVRRRLLRVRGEGALPAPTALPAALFIGERKVGELRSVAPASASASVSAGDPAGGGFIGLAMLSLLNLTPGVALAIAPNTSPSVHVIDSASPPSP